MWRRGADGHSGWSPGPKKHSKTFYSLTVVQEQANVAVLSRNRILERIDKDVDDREGLIITPILDPKSAFDADSVDLRLGCHFLLPKSQQPVYSPDEDSFTSLHDRVQGKRPMGAAHARGS